MPNPLNSKIRRKFDLTANEKSYIMWLVSSLIFATTVFIGLSVYGYNVYSKAINLFNSTNQKIVQKTGLEISTNINTEIVGRVEEAINKKINLSQMHPERARNIFFYNAYINFNPPQPVMTTTKEIN